MDAHALDALQYFRELTRDPDYPPQLAALLAQARYAQAIGTAPVELPILKETLELTAQAHPELKRDIGRTVAAIERGKRGGARST